MTIQQAIDNAVSALNHAYPTEADKSNVFVKDAYAFLSEAHNLSETDFWDIIPQVWTLIPAQPSGMRVEMTQEDFADFVGF